MSINKKIILLFTIIAIFVFITLIVLPTAKAEVSGWCETQCGGPQSDDQYSQNCCADGSACAGTSYGSISGSCMPFDVVGSCFFWDAACISCDSGGYICTRSHMMRRNLGPGGGCDPEDWCLCTDRDLGPCPGDSYCGDGTCDLDENYLSCDDCPFPSLSCNIINCRSEVSTETTVSGCLTNCTDPGYQSLGTYDTSACADETCTCCIRCGDNVCNGSETFATCPQDCEPIVCGDSTCNGSETCSSCPTDCGVCDPGCTPNCSLCAPDTCVGNTCTEPACNTACSGTKDCGGPPPVTSIGFVNVQTTSGLIKLNVKALSDADLYDIVRIMMPGGVIGVADLVDAEDRNGSPVKIYLNAAFRAKFWRKLD